jgi:hypothetical protein
MALSPVLVLRVKPPGQEADRQSANCHEKAFHFDFLHSLLLHS